QILIAELERLPYQVGALAPEKHPGETRQGKVGKGPYAHAPAGRRQRHSALDDAHRPPVELAPDDVFALAHPGEGIFLPVHRHDAEGAGTRITDELAVRTVEGRECHARQPDAAVEMVRVGEQPPRFRDGHWVLTLTLVMYRPCHCRSPSMGIRPHSRLSN